ncbi:MAG: FumA C-terminus/TtdB family hydratase beta subunit [Candidatus Bathyarchaeia archaeon]|nr:fumarate hydratase C-terminal domain-containing protein [Candidatus Bathyarchaeota archaeon]
MGEEAVSTIYTPVSAESLKKLKAGETVYLTGIVHTIRDAGYERLLAIISRGEVPPVEFRDMAVWHCGPIAKRTDGRWVVVAAGPTTSSRFTSAVAEVIRRLKVKIVIGKGPIGGEAVEALASEGGVYLASTGGAGAYYAGQVKGVESVHWMDLGMPAALWTLRVEGLGPLVVAVDSKGKDLFGDRGYMVEKEMRRLFRELGIDPSHNYVWWPRRRSYQI